MGLAGSFISGIAFGPINLSVVELTLKKSLSSAKRFCSAAALVEFGQAFLAVLFGKLIASKIDEFPELKVLVFLFCFLFGAYFILKKDKPKPEIDIKSQRSSFFSGLLIATLNPQTLPYWIFVLAYLKSANMLALYGWNFLLFLGGVAIGKYLILTIYSYLSVYISRHICNLDAYISRILGIVLLVIGVIQALKYYFF